MAIMENACKVLEWGADEGKMTWREAKALARKKGNGWRLPTMQELVASFDYAKAKPRITGFKEDYYWSYHIYGGGEDSFVSVLNLGTGETFVHGDPEEETRTRFVRTQ